MLTTKGLLRRPGNPGTKGRLLLKSMEAYLLALETINRLTITYRLETFCALATNAWELLLKAKLIEDAGHRTTIYYPKERGRRPKSLSLRDCVKRVYPDERDATRRNIERVEELRDEAVHLFIAEIPREVLGLLQACVLNYYSAISTWFGITLTDRIPVGMMTIVFDISPERFDLSNALMRRQLGKDATDYLIRLTDELRSEYEDLGQAHEFSVQVKYDLAVVKSVGDAAALVASGADGIPTRYLKVAKDPSQQFPYRQTDLVTELNGRLRGAPRVSPDDIQAVVFAYEVRRRQDWFYHSAVKGSPKQYSAAFADWFEAFVRRDPDFIARARDKRRRARASERTKAEGPGLWEAPAGTDPP